MIKRPISPLPFYVEEDTINYSTCKVQHIKCSDHTFMGYLYTDGDSPEYRPDEVKADAEYIVYASNEYPGIVELLERIESTTKDQDTADKIRSYLKQKKIWT